MKQKHNYFYCLKKNGEECTRTMTGQTACEICKENKCKSCGRANTKFCLECENSGLSETMKEKLQESFLKRRNL